MYRLENHTVALGFGEITTGNDLDEFALILEADVTTLPLILSIPKPYQWPLCGVCWLMLFVGTYFKYFSYEHLFDQLC